jgi:hypothetical protein
MASAISCLRATYRACSLSSHAARSLAGRAAQPGKARRAAATARSGSAWPPSEIIATGTVVDGLMTCRAFASAGGAQLP